MVLDDKPFILEIKENFIPFTYYTPKNSAKYIIELKNNTVKKTKTEVGDTIRFKNR